MSYRHHLVCIVAAFGLAMWFLASGSASAALAGVTLALLICPLVMGVAMWLLMRQPQPTTHQRETERQTNHATPARAGSWKE